MKLVIVRRINKVEAGGGERIRHCPSPGDPETVGLTMRMGVYELNLEMILTVLCINLGEEEVVKLIYF